MNTEHKRTEDDLREIGMDVLINALGFADTTRFLRLVVIGQGDSVEEKYQREATRAPGELKARIAAYRRKKAEAAGNVAEANVVPAS